MCRVQRASVTFVVKHTHLFACEHTCAEKKGAVLVRVKALHFITWATGVLGQIGLWTTLFCGPKGESRRKNFSNPLKISLRTSRYHVSMTYFQLIPWERAGSLRKLNL